MLLGNWMNVKGDKESLVVLSYTQLNSVNIFNRLYYLQNLEFLRLQCSEYSEINWSILTYKFQWAYFYQFIFFVVKCSICMQSGTNNKICCHLIEMIVFAEMDKVSQDNLIRPIRINSKNYFLKIQWVSISAFHQPEKITHVESLFSFTLVDVKTRKKFAVHSQGNKK